VRPANLEITEEALLNLKFLDRDTSSSTLQLSAKDRPPLHWHFSAGDHVRLTTTNSPVNSVTAHASSMDAQIVAYELGFAKICYLHPPPCFVEDCSWRLDNCESFVTSKTMLDAVHIFATQLGRCCGVYQQILGPPDCHRDSASLSICPGMI
jgi:hypothetical protein